MSLSEWEDFVYRAGHLDDADPIAFWKEQSTRQAAIAERFKGVREIRILAEDTDLVLDVAGRTWTTPTATRTSPTARSTPARSRAPPAATSPSASTPPTWGTTSPGVRLRVRGGRVVEHEASSGAGFLERMLDMDAGARYLGEVAFGMNDEIQSPTRDTLFDEKIGGTCHVALGMAFPECGGTNTSGLHWDMVCDLRRGGEVHADGESSPRREVPVSDPRIERLADVVMNYSTCRWARATPSSSRGRRWPRT